MIRGAIDHIDLTVPDLDLALPFYDAVLDFLGYARSSAYAGDVPVWVHRDMKPRLSIGLHQASQDVAHDRRNPGLHHLAFHASSRGEVDRLHQLLCDIGATILDAPAEYDYTAGYYAVFFADPGGIKLEIAYEPDSQGA